MRRIGTLVVGVLLVGVVGAGLLDQWRDEANGKRWSFTGVGGAPVHLAAAGFDGKRWRDPLHP